MDTSKPREPLIISGFTALEMIQGCRDKTQQRAVSKILSLCRVERLSQQDCKTAFQLFSHYHLSHSLGMIDALIAQTALSLNQPLYTFNHKHYRMIEGLQIIQPYQRFIP